MEHVTCERQFRTPYSEGYYLKNDKGDMIGRVDLHFAADVVYATLIIEIDTTEDDVMDLIEQIDEDLVMTADVHRDDLLVTVYRGKDLGFYSDDFFGDDEDDDETDETGKGHDEDDDDDDEDDDDDDDEPDHEPRGR